MDSCFLMDLIFLLYHRHPWDTTYHRPIGHLVSSSDLDHGHIRFHYRHRLLVTTWPHRATSIKDVYSVSTVDVNFGFKVLHDRRKCGKLLTPILQRKHPIEEVPAQFYPVPHIRIQHAMDVRTGKLPKIDSDIVAVIYIYKLTIKPVGFFTQNPNNKQQIHRVFFVWHPGHSFEQ